MVLPPSLRIWCRTCCRGLLTALPRVTLPCDLRDRRQEDSAVRSGRPGEVAARRGLAAGQGGSLPPAGVDDSGSTAPHMAGRPGAAAGGRGKKPCPGNLGSGGPGRRCSCHAVQRQRLDRVRDSVSSALPRPPTTPESGSLPLGVVATVAACGRATWARCRRG